MAAIIAHEELIHLLHEVDDPTEILRFLPKWETVDRLEYLVEGYRNGTLSALEVSELDAVCEIIPAICEHIHCGSGR